MSLAVYDRTKGFWFGTENRMGWFPTPLRGANMSPQAWNTGGVTLNGGGYEFGSYGSHKVYQYEWAGSSAREVAQLMKSFYDGTYGRGLIYFQDCLMFDANVLPARVADPSMALRDEGASLVYGVTPTGIPQISGVNELPVMAARYDLSSVPAGFRRGGGGVFIPIPEGYTLRLGAIYTSTGSGGVYYTRQGIGAGAGTSTRMTPIADTASDILNHSVTYNPATAAGVWVWAGRTGTTASTVTIKAITARLIRSDRVGTPDYTRLNSGPWTPGQGNSGCRFSGPPTYIANGPFDGGQIGFAATFREVGSWVNV